MAGTLFHETVQVLVKAMKPQDYRLEILHTLRQLVIGLGPSSSSAHKDIYKCIKNGLNDRSMAVRSAAAKVCGQWICSRKMSSVVGTTLSLG